MNKKLFAQRLGISLLWVLAPFVVVGTFLGVSFLVVELLGNIGLIMWLNVASAFFVVPSSRERPVRLLQLAYCKGRPRRS